MTVAAQQATREMSDSTLARLLDDLARVPVIAEQLIEAYADGQWLYGPCCWGCGLELDQRTAGCVTCQRRHEKRRQRHGCSPAPLRQPWKSHGPMPSPVTAEHKEART